MSGDMRQFQRKFGLSRRTEASLRPDHPPFDLRPPGKDRFSVDKYRGCKRTGETIPLLGGFGGDGLSHTDGEGRSSRNDGELLGGVPVDGRMFCARRICRRCVRSRLHERLSRRRPGVQGTEEQTANAGRYD